MSDLGGVPHPIVSCLGGRPTEQQWAAISMPLEPYVLIAGAGSGKTAVMAARVVYLASEIDPAVRPGDVLCLTFTNAATENLVLRTRRALAHLDGDASGEEPLVLNYHRFGQEILARHGLRVGIEPGARILTDTQRAQLCARVLDDLSFRRLHSSWQPTIVDDILALADQMQDHLVPREALERLCRQRIADIEGTREDKLIPIYEERLELARAVERFTQRKRDLGVIDFGDQIALALHVVTERSEVAAEYRERFPVVLLDEYQDTNVAQARLLEALFGGGHPVTAVGDPDQNIYAWRGASLHNLLTFPETFRRADGRPSARLPLYVNFRSGSRILAAADAIIASLPETQRPDPDKRLEPVASRGEGSVEVRGFDDVQAEADAIAQRILEHHREGTPWREMAVLCRTHRGSRPIARALGARGIPVEVTGLAGLLDRPEIVDLLSYARAALDPTESVALGRILTGPRYRIGPADLASLATWAKDRTGALRHEDDETGEAMPYLVVEALEHLEEVEGLTDQGRERLAEARIELVALRDAAHEPASAFFARVLARTRLLEELDAHAAADLGRAARRTVAAFLDHVAAFRPLEGEPTLAALLEHLDALGDRDREDWAGPAGDREAVQVMTVHAAKGLEFDVVFVIDLAAGTFPNTRVRNDPMRGARTLDFELRGDRAMLPAFDGDLAAFHEELKVQAEQDERRTCYVALTRARRHLWASAARWYEGRTTASEWGAFLVQLARWGAATGSATVDLPDEGPPTNPLLDDADGPAPWPGPARPDDADDLFPDGWRAAALRAAARGGVPDDLLSSLDPQGHETFARSVEDRRLLAAHLVERERAVTGERWLPPQVSVNGIVEHARCPKRFAWTSVRPLPRTSGPSARVGTEVHRWIELRSQGQSTLLADEAMPDLSDDELHDDAPAREPGTRERLRRAYEESRFAGLVPLHVERPFLLSFGRFTVSGRIDAIFGTPGGAWEVVDWKTGRVPDAGDALARMQLDLYALACMEIWGKRREDVRMTYLYLAHGVEVSHDAPDADEIRTRVAGELAAIESRAFPARPSERCRHCDFLTFCPDGAASLAAGTAEHL